MYFRRIIPSAVFGVNKPSGLPVYSATTEGLVSPNRRGKNISPITISDHVRAFVKLHIESFPALTSHYCRKRTSRKYLDSNLNVSQCLICAEVAVKKKKKDETQRKFLSAGPYYIRIIIKVFINQKKMSAAFAIYEKESLMTTYQGHRARNEQTRQPKAIDKQCAIENSDSIKSIIFD